MIKFYYPELFDKNAQSFESPSLGSPASQSDSKNDNCLAPPISHLPSIFLTSTHNSVS